MRLSGTYIIQSISLNALYYARLQKNALNIPCDWWHQKRGGPIKKDLDSDRKDF